MAFSEWCETAIACVNRNLLVAAIVGLTISTTCVGCIKPAAPPAAATTNTASGAPAHTDAARGAHSTSGGDATKAAGPTTSAATKSAAPETVNIEGSSTVYLIAQAMAVEFEATGNYKVSLARNGTGGGYKSFALRRCELWNASRPVAEKEKVELSEKRIDWLELEIAIDGLSVAVNPKNDWCTELTVADLRKLWKPDSTVTKWSDLNPQWPWQQKIELFGARYRFRNIRVLYGSHCRQEGTKSH